MSLFAYIPATKAWRHRRQHALCLEAIARIDEIVDGEVSSGRRRVALEAHIEACRPCAHEADVVRGLKEAIARVCDDGDPKLISKLDKLAQDLCDGRE